MIEGFIGDWRIRAQLEKELQSKEDLAGYWTKEVLKQQGLIGVDANTGAIAVCNTLMVHEPLHALRDVYGLKLKHKDIYIISAGLTQWWISSRIIDPLAIEARVRKLAADDVDPEWSEESK